jgi:hypothetical protein
VRRIFVDFDASTRSDEMRKNDADGCEAGISFALKRSD